MAEGLVLFEQRRLVRRELIYYLKIIDPADGAELGRMGDIHSKGMLILSGQGWPLEKVYDLSLELPKALQNSSGRFLDLKCQVVWTGPGPKNTSYHESGVRFISLTKAQEELIKELTDAYAMPA